MYGEKEAKKLTGEMYSYALGLSDSSAITIPYCFAFDASKLVTIGRDFGVLKSKPAKRVSSYVSALCETVHQLSNHLAGAVAIGTFFFNSLYFVLSFANSTIIRDNFSTGILPSSSSNIIPAISPFSRVI